MKASILLLAIVAAALPLTQLSAEAEAETKRPSWIERIFEKKEATAEPEKEQGAKAAKKEAKKDQAAKPREFSEAERELLEDWQQGKAKGKGKKKKKSLPPGLRKKVERGGELPPGWKKKLNIGETLPEELEKETRSLPEEILKRLPEIEEGTEILEIGDEIIRVVENSREIIDILSRRTGGEEKD